MKLNQVIAVEKGIKSKVNSEIDTILKAVQKPALFDGFIKNYRRRADADPEDVPNQKQNVQLKADLTLDMVAKRWTELYDVVAQKDFANCLAVADVAVGEITLLTGVPVTYLLFLEKQLTDLHTIVSKFPVLDPAEVWTADAGSGLYRTEPTLTTRTKKVQKAIVLYPATPEHPAQTQLITEDEAVGTWELTKLSGALRPDEIRSYLSRIATMIIAVKSAREAANMFDAPKKDIGSKIFDWIFKA